ncbi:MULTISPECIES: hypothetical protein [Sphingomonas]|nr:MULTISPECIES: hypothetical protein [Sphingomonas]
MTIVGWSSLALVIATSLASTMAIVVSLLFSVIHLSKKKRSR